MLPLDPVFKAYDIRGTVPEQLDTEVARAVGAAFAGFTGAPRIVVARDMRPSGVDLSTAFTEGVLDQGVDVVDLGLASTDYLYYASGALDAPGAMFTASHNPARYNGIKLCLSGARPVGQDTGLAEVKASAANGGPPPTGERGTRNEQDLLPAFGEHVRGFFGTGPVRPLKIVVDCANGMGGLIAPMVFGELTFEVEYMYPELDGTFPNHPADPINPANLVDLQARVLSTGADLGLAFDGDADRVFLVDDEGVVVSGSTTTALVAAALLDRNGRSGTVIYNLICSKAVPEVVAEHGGTPLRSRVGHSFIKQTMADSGAIFGGEHSGHYYFADNFRADSGIIATMVVLGVLCEEDLPLSRLRKPFERYVASGEINTEVDDPKATLAAVEPVLADLPGATVDRLDGLTVDCRDWWVNLRPSNTEPLLRCNLEAADEATCREKTEYVLNLVKEA
ncbi:MAG: Phosphomannomutase [uncultured Acidimicrobiales bacterium]|uniref:Phosphomannomutase n=1 Tax=uncultured Acidimicrobiales bacterium TaxID=310071 RepID=A0A6J4I7L3_9ACTN|nr:MAG: Phosphomannomutase [uncultured Acidimicrobiales bacterium]